MSSGTLNPTHSLTHIRSAVLQSLVSHHVQLSTITANQAFHINVWCNLPQHVISVPPLPPFTTLVYSAHAVTTSVIVDSNWSFLHFWILVMSICRESAEERSQSAWWWSLCRACTLAGEFSLKLLVKCYTWQRNQGIGGQPDCAHIVLLQIYLDACYAAGSNTTKILQPELNCSSCLCMVHDGKFAV